MGGWVGNFCGSDPGHAACGAARSGGGNKACYACRFGCGRITRVEDPDQGKKFLPRYRLDITLQ